MPRRGWKADTDTFATIAHTNRRATLLSHNHLRDVVDILEQAEPANHVRFAATLDKAAAAVGVGVRNRRFDLTQSQSEPLAA